MARGPRQGVQHWLRRVWQMLSASLVQVGRASAGEAAEIQLARRKVARQKRRREMARGPRQGVQHSMRGAVR